MDVSSITSMREFIRGFQPVSLDILINNAGVLPSKRMMTQEEVEITWATNVRGPYFLTTHLLPKLKSAPVARVIFVSSGGMYPQRLDLEDLDWSKRSFDGVRAYANSKRAMVILNQMFAQKYSDTSIRFHAMHPGWVDTPAVRTSIPTFYRVMKRFLRTPEQGADTIFYLAVAQSPQRKNGAFWFDRQERKLHLLPGTREKIEDRAKLWNLLEKQCK